MTNPNDPSFPVLLNPKDTYSSTGGLTKREYFAAMAIQGIATSGNLTISLDVETAVTIADALIAELNKEAKP